MKIILGFLLVTMILLTAREIIEIKGTEAKTEEFTLVDSGERAKKRLEFQVFLAKETLENRIPFEIAVIQFHAICQEDKVIERFKEVWKMDNSMEVCKFILLRTIEEYKKNHAS